ncbi:protein SCO1/2 [Granulicella arctica]|uniref:Protein SCO1/2 n=1 Tax=Granulicella arctica TaxID=940613 RepID=A0A7Y9PIN3_9BACT|nr:SCO family protein [Granulicella arctica]NYF80444.1 protein SCO1/2 [Granulicella arctica]
MRRIPFVLLLVLFTLPGCHRSAPVGGSSTANSQKSFPVRGKILATDPTHVLLDHEAVPGFMDAMTMSYKLKDPSVVNELHPGDRITATILVDQDAAGFRNPQLDHIVIIGQAKPDYLPRVQYHVPQAGDDVPNFELLNQSDRLIHLSQFKGRVLLATFIYTRCQLADFCPRMSTNFAEIDKALAADPALYAKTHLLSISFDPAYDTPTVLKKYGEAYTGRFAKETFSHWDFAAPPAEKLPAMTQFFDVGVTPGDSKSLTHSLSTVLIGKDGKVVAWYPTNDWKPADVVAAVRAAAAS